MYYLFCLPRQKRWPVRLVFHTMYRRGVPYSLVSLQHIHTNQAAEEPSVGENATGPVGRPPFDPKPHPRSNADSTGRKSVISNQSLEVKIGWSCKISQKKSSSWFYLLVWFASYVKLLTIYRWVVSASLKKAQQ